MDEIEIVEKLTETCERSKSNTHQIDEIKNDIKEVKQDQKAIYELTSSVKIIANNLETIKTDISEVKQGQSCLADKMDKEISNVKNDLSEVKNAPEKSKAKKWDNFSSKAGKLIFEIVKYLTICGLGAGITYLITK